MGQTPLVVGILSLTNPTEAVLLVEFIFIDRDVCLRDVARDPSLPRIPDQTDIEVGDVGIVQNPNCLVVEWNHPLAGDHDDPWRELTEVDLAVDEGSRNLLIGVVDVPSVPNHWLQKIIWDVNRDALLAFLVPLVDGAGPSVVDDFGPFDGDGWPLWC